MPVRSPPAAPDGAAELIAAVPSQTLNVFDVVLNQTLPLSAAVKPAPRDIVEEVKLASLKFDIAVASFPAKRSKLNVSICPQEKTLKKSAIKRILNFSVAY